MQSPRIILSARAEADLADIENYIVAEEGLMRAALVRTRIVATLRNLAHTPGIGRKRPELRGKNALFFPSSPWLVVYRPLRDLTGIRVIRSAHGRRDLRRVL